MTEPSFNEAEALKPRILAVQNSIHAIAAISFNEAEALKPRIQLQLRRGGGQLFVLQ